MQDTAGDVELSLTKCCKNLFHAHCLKDWRRKSETCPICRSSRFIKEPKLEKQETLKAADVGHTQLGHKRNKYQSFWKAVEEGDLKKCRKLLDGGLNVNKRNPDGDTALCLAARKGHTEIARLLIHHPADVGKRAKNHRFNAYAHTPLEIASILEHRDMMLLLVENEASIYATTSLIEPLGGGCWGSRGNSEWCSLFLAANAGYDDVVSVMLKDRSDKMTPLHIATEKGAFSVIESLIKRVSDINARDIYGRSALHLLSEYRYGDLEPTMTRKIIDSNWDVNARDNCGRTPLHVAAQKGHNEILKALIQKGAEVDVKDHQGKTPFDLAREAGNKETENALLRNTGVFKRLKLKMEVSS